MTKPRGTARLRRQPYATLLWQPLWLWNRRSFFVVCSAPQPSRFASNQWGGMVSCAPVGYRRMTKPAKSSCATKNQRLRDHAKITSHLAAGPCGARTFACRVDTRVDARCSGAKKRREESRRRKQECARHGFRCDVILALVLSSTDFSLSLRSSVVLDRPSFFVACRGDRLQ
jgi:hypothetical protein